MSQQSSIEWTDATWNPVRGCTKVSPGCANCYAETFSERFRGLKGHAYEQGFDLRLVPDALAFPLKLALKREDCPQCMGSGSKNDAISCGDCGGTGFLKRGRRIFVNSMSDLFHEGVPDAYIDQVFAAMALAPEHTFQVLTKRADRMRSYMCNPRRHADIVEAMDMPVWLPPGRRFPRVPENWPMPNVWLGVSVENQHFADERIPLLLQTPAAVRFISAEPLLGPVNLTGDPDPCRTWLRSGFSVARGLLTDNWQPPLDWVIVGGESGPKARAMNVEWAREIVDQCKAAGLAVFVKQLGAKPFEPYSDGTPFVELHLTSRKGGDMAEWPEDLRVRQMPAGNTA